ncbi:uncharacterized protein LOC116259353 isoform X2 [Nymphaea colorata]|uniref:uncharacterized protein LOC116259353 isoform X2 n=1 Tax=Nymphaea colorata TaxID=210225 RepID=UPI00214F0AEA|nr:uncharacterized protein LOC116259353 isoform X2 [Nymphaea colorata]
MSKETRLSSSNKSENRAKGTEVFIGALGRSVTENMIHQVFSSCGEILEIRLMKDKNGISKGYCFVRFTTKDAALRAQKQKDGYVMEGKKIVVALSSDQSSLFFGSLRKDWSQEEFEKLVRQAFDDVLSVDLAMPLSPGESGRGKKQKNRGFAFVHFTSHAAAARAFRIGSKPDFRLGDDWHPIVDWAEKEAELDPEEMARITVAFVANLPGDVTEDYLRRLFEPFGKLERVAISRKSNVPVGFVHYTSRSDLDKAIKELDGKLVQGPGKGPKFNLQVSVARTIVKADKRTHDESQAKSTRGASQYKSSNTYDHSDDRKMKVPRVDSPVEDTGVADPYEAAVLSLPSSITGRLLRIFRLGIATRYDIDIQCITSLKELPESTAVAVLDEFLSSGPVGHAKGAYLTSLIAKHQAGRLGITHDSFAVRRRSTEFTSIEPDFAKERASLHTPTYDSYISRPAATSSIRETAPSLSYEETIRADLRLASSGADRRPTFRFDPFTGTPYKFDPFTGEPIQHETFPSHSSSRY